MHDAPWKSEGEDKRFRPRIKGKVTHVKAWRIDADWPDENADWEKILSQNTVFPGPFPVPKLGREGK